MRNQLILFELDFSVFPSPSSLSFRFRVMFCNSNACNAKRIPWSPPVKVEVRPKSDDGDKFRGGGSFEDNHVRKGGKKSKKSAAAPKIRVIVEDPKKRFPKVPTTRPFSSRDVDDDEEYEEEYEDDEVRHGT